MKARDSPKKKDGKNSEKRRKKHPTKKILNEKRKLRTKNKKER